MAEFLPRNFHNNYPEEVLEVVTCHVVSTTENEDIPSSSSEMVEELKDLSSFDIKNLLSLPQVAKNALIDALLDLEGSSVLTSVACTYTF